MFKKISVLVMIGYCFFFMGCARLATVAPEISDEQMETIAVMASTAASEAIANTKAGGSNPYLPDAGGASAGATAIVLLGLYSWWKDKYEIKAKT